MISKNDNKQSKAKQSKAKKRRIGNKAFFKFTTGFAVFIIIPWKLYFFISFVEVYKYRYFFSLEILITLFIQYFFLTSDNYT